jgi:hypothetical protein
MELKRKKTCQPATSWCCYGTTHCSTVTTETFSQFAVPNGSSWIVIVGKVKVIVIVRCGRPSVQYLCSRLSAQEREVVFVVVII